MLSQDEQKKKSTLGINDIVWNKNLKTEPSSIRMTPLSHSPAQSTEENRVAMFSRRRSEMVSAREINTPQQAINNSNIRVNYREINSKTEMKVQSPQAFASQSQEKTRRSEGFKFFSKSFSGIGKSSLKVGQSKKYSIILSNKGLD